MKTVVDLVVEKTGISQQQAEDAVTTIADYLKSRLPEPVAGHIDTLLSADVSSVSGRLDGLLPGGLGGLLGGKKD